MPQTARDLSDAELLAIIGQPQQSPSPQSAPVGVRNRNQGNLKDGDFARSQPGYTGANGAFATFATPEDGNRAQEALLANNYLAKGFNTPSAIVNRYAPVGPENSQESVTNYINYVSQKLGIEPNAPVSPDQVGALAQAMREFETGQTSGAVSAPSQGVDKMDDASLMALVHDSGPINQVGLEALIDRPGQSRDNPFIITSDTPRELLTNLTKGTWIQTTDGQGNVQVNRLAGNPYVNENGAQNNQVVAGGNAYLHTPGIEDAARAFTTAAAEQIPFLDEAAQAAYAAATGRSFSDVRDQYQAMNAVDNSINRGVRDLGGIAGAALGLAAPGGEFIGAGATNAAKIGRAALVGGGLGGLYGAGNADGGFADRVQAGVTGAGIGAATGGIAQRIGSVAETAPSAARRLSREGVDLTPGMMFGETPIVGPVLRSVEEGATSIPVIGPIVAGARQRATDTFNRAAINRALVPIGKQLPKGQTGGYEAIDFAQKALGDAYDEVLPRISAQLDQGLYDDLAATLSRASAEMPQDLLGQLTQVLQDRVFRNVDQSTAVLDGPALKTIESELGALGREYRRANDPAQLAFGRAVDDFRTGLRDMLARQNPEEAAQLQRINRGYANLVRVEDAAGSTASLAAEGVFTPTQLGVAANRGASRSSRGRGEALMQDLASAGRSIIPSRTGDSGTATRGALTALAAGGGAVVNPVVAGGTAVLTGAAYSPVAQRVLNAFYRATDMGGRLRALSEFRSLAARNPALVPYLEQATRQLRPSAPSQSQPTAPPVAAQPLPIAP